MRFLAPFDGSPMSESALALVALLARAHDDVALFSVVEPDLERVRVRGPLRTYLSVVPDKESVPETAATTPQDRVAERLEYLRGLTERLPGGVEHHCEALSHDDAARGIIEWSLKHRPDIIVMSTHGRSGRVHVLFGDVAEEVVRSGVGPVLLVPPERPAQTPTRPSARPRAGR